MQRVAESIPRARLAGMVNSASPVNRYGSRSGSRGYVHAGTPQVSPSHSKAPFNPVNASPSPPHSARIVAFPSSADQSTPADGNHSTYLYNPNFVLGGGSDPLYRPHTGVTTEPSGRLNNGIGAGIGIEKVPRYDLGSYQPDEMNRLVIEEAAEASSADEFIPPAALRGEVGRLETKLRQNETQLQSMRTENISAKALSVQGGSGSAVSAATLLEMQELWRTIHYQQDDMGRATAELKQEYDRLKAEYALAIGDRERIQQEHKASKARQEEVVADYERQLQNMRDELRQMSVRLVQQGDAVVDAKVLHGESEAKNAQLAINLEESRAEVRQLHEDLKALTNTIEGLQRQRSGDSIEVEGRMAALKIENDALRAELVPTLSQRDTFAQQYQLAAQQAAALQEQLSSLEDEFQRLRQNHSSETKHANHIETELRSLKSLLESEQRRNAALQQTVAAHEEVHKQNKEHESHIALLKNEIETLKTQSAPTIKIDQSSNTDTDVTQGTDTVAIRSVPLEKELEALREKELATETLINSLKVQIGEKDQSFAEAQQKAKEAADVVINDLRQQSKELKEAVEAANLSIKSKEEAIQSLDKQLSEHQHSLAEYKHAAEAKQSSIEQFVVDAEAATQSYKRAFEEMEKKFLVAQGNFARAQALAEEHQRRLLATQEVAEAADKGAALREAALLAKVAELEGVLVALELSVSQAKPEAAQMVSHNQQTSPPNSPKLMTRGQSAFTSTSDLKAAAATFSAATSPILAPTALSPRGSPKISKAIGHSAFTSTSDLRLAAQSNAIATSPLLPATTDRTMETEATPMASTAVGSDTEDDLAASVPTALYLPLAVDELVAELHQLRESARNEAQLRQLLEEQSEALKDTVAEWEHEADRLGKELAAAMEKLAASEAQRQQLALELPKTNATITAQRDNIETLQSLLAAERQRCEDSAAEKAHCLSQIRELQTELDSLVSAEAMRVARQTTRSCSPFVRPNPTTERGISPYRIENRERGVSPMLGPKAESRGVSPYRVDNRERGISPLRIGNQERGVSPMLGPESHSRGASPMRQPASPLRLERGVSPFRSTSSSVGVGPATASQSTRGMGTSPFRSSSPLRATAGTSTGGAFQSTLEENEALAAEVEELSSELSEVRSVAQQRIADLHDLLATEKVGKEELERQLDTLQQAYNGELAAHSELKAAVAKMGATPHHTASIIEVTEALEAERRAWSIEKKLLMDQILSSPLPPSTQSGGIRSSTPMRSAHATAKTPSPTDLAPSEATLRAENEALQRQQRLLQQQPTPATRMEYRMSTPSAPNRPASSGSHLSTPLSPPVVGAASSVSSPASSNAASGKNRHRVWY